MKLFKRKESNGKNQKQVSSADIAWPDHVVVLDDRTFDEFISSYPVVVVDFWASWCGPCKAMGPRMRRLSKMYQRKAAFGKLDVQQNKTIANRYHVQGIPHFVFFQHGRKVTTITGARSIGKLKETIEGVLKN